MLDSKPKLLATEFPVLTRDKLTTLQVNLGYVCNQSCNHCHVNAGPKRTEIMSRSNIDAVLLFAKKNAIQTLDLTGGAPEMNPDFTYLVIEATKLGIQVIDRCNLTILMEPEYQYIAKLLADHRVHIVASLPCYEADNVDEQRGKNVFSASIDALKLLNELGYGEPGSDLTLDLVYNPTGATLPPSQCELQPAYKKQLQERHAVVFNELLTITNMPIQRFGSMLLSKGLFDDYMNTLKAAYQTENLASVMCKNLLSVDWQGYLYDCDFNQMLDMRINNNHGKALHLSELDGDWLAKNKIQVADHCYGCTAGQGSSCGGALSG